MQGRQYSGLPIFLTLMSIVMCSVMTGAPLQAQDADVTATAKAGADDASAATALREKVSEAYKKIKTYEADILIEIKPIGMPDAQVQHYNYSLAFDRDASALKIERPELDLVVNKGKLQLQASDISERHLAMMVADPLSAKDLFEKAPYVSQPMPFDLLLMLGEDVIPTNAKKVAGKAGDQNGLNFVQGTSDFTLYLNPQTNLIDKISQTTKHERNGQTMTLMFTYDYKVKTVDKPIASKTFKLALGDSKAVDNLKDLVGEAQSNDGGSALKGKPAPDFTLKNSDGKEVSLSGLMKENKVVVLDFWATWCGPCRMTLPQLQKVYEWAASEKLSVSINTVNQMETVGKAKGMWATMKLSMPILMDSEGKVSNAYGISAIPQLIVIADGKVHNVHLGASPTTGDDLKAELQQLLKQK